MKAKRTFLSGLWASGTAALLATSAMAQPTAQELMKSRLGTDQVGPIVAEAFEHAAKPVTPELRAKALECFQNNSCETGTGGKLTVAYADGFGENVWRQVTKMEFIQQALTYPEVGAIKYTSAQGDTAKAISDIGAYIAQKVDVIVVFADGGEALRPIIREATAAGIKVVLNAGTQAGETGVDYLTSASEDLCQLGAAMVDAAFEGNPHAKTALSLGGTPGNPLSATLLRCSDEQAAKRGLSIVGKFDTNWTKEGAFTAVSAGLSQFGPVDAYLYDYADGFRGALRAFKSAGLPLNFVFATRTDEQGLFCDWEALGSPDFKIYYSSAANFDSRLSLTAALMAIRGEKVPAHVDVPFAMTPVKAGMCDPSLPMETSVTTLVDTETLKAMFK